MYLYKRGLKNRGKTHGLEDYEVVSYHSLHLNIYFNLKDNQEANITCYSYSGIKIINININMFANKLALLLTM